MNIIKKYRWLIIVVTLIGLGSALAFYFLKPVKYDTSLAFTINRINKQETAEYQYDDYYAIQASDLFSQTVMSWFMTPSVLLEIYQKAGIDPRISSLEEISSRFKVKKYSPQNIVVRFQERDSASAEKISQAVTTVIQNMASASNQTANQKSLFEVKGNKPVIVKKEAVLWFNLIIGFLAGLIISLIASYLIEYLRRGEVRQ